MTDEAEQKARQKPKNPMSVIKCGCGQVMRYKHWGTHSAKCQRPSVSVTPQDVETLFFEERKVK